MLEKPTDFELVKRFIGGDEASFNEIARRYQQKIYWHARRMIGNHLDADEVVQEVLLVLYDKLKDFKFQSSLYTWVYRITATRSINYLNKLKIKRFFSFDDKQREEIRYKEDIVTTIEQKEKLAHLDKVLQKLPSKQREIFVMRNFDGLSYEEISEITGKSVGGLKANYFHAFAKINELMSKTYGKD
ncbi:MAG: RNA polymerase sigma factor [Ignavibacterium sp.]|nr:RNA polymerase sigma factor [Ignavibacterium sp.]